MVLGCEGFGMSGCVVKFLLVCGFLRVDVMLLSFVVKVVWGCYDMFLFIGMWFCVFMCVGW